MTDVKAMANSEKTAVIVVDMQRDFMEGGNLAVTGASYEEWLPTVKQFLDDVRSHGKMTICYSQDWHPAGHSSFASTHKAELFSNIKLKRADGETEYEQTMWPDHCLQDSEGAKFVVDVTEGEYVQQKGTRLAFDSYSAFMDDGGQKTELAGVLKDKGIEKCFVLGLATDFCVAFTGKDAKEMGFETVCIKELCKGIDTNYDWAKFPAGTCSLSEVQEALKA